MEGLDAAEWGKDNVEKDNAEVVASTLYRATTGQTIFHSSKIIGPRYGILGIKKYLYAISFWYIFYVMYFLYLIICSYEVNRHQNVG